MYSNFVCEVYRTQNIKFFFKFWKMELWTYKKLRHLCLVVDIHLCAYQVVSEASVWSSFWLTNYRLWVHISYLSKYQMEFMSMWCQIYMHIGNWGYLNKNIGIQIGHTKHIKNYNVNEKSIFNRNPMRWCCCNISRGMYFDITFCGSCSKIYANQNNFKVFC